MPSYIAIGKLIAGGGRLAYILAEWKTEYPNKLWIVFEI